MPSRIAAAAHARDPAFLGRLPGAASFACSAASTARRAISPPRPFCPHCGSRSVEIYPASGRAILWSYVINHRPRPDMGTEPYAIAVVELAEGPRMMTNIVSCPQTPDGAAAGHAAEGEASPNRPTRSACRCSNPWKAERETEIHRHRRRPQKPLSLAGFLGLSQIGLHADAALNATRNAGSSSPPTSTASPPPARVPSRSPSTSGSRRPGPTGPTSGAASFMLHVRHAAAAINEGLCSTVLITHGESGRSRVGAGRFGGSPASQAGQFEMPYGVRRPAEHVHSFRCFAT